MKTRFFSREALPHPRRVLLALAACFFLAAAIVPALAPAQPVTVTEPLMRYGLGVLQGAVYSPDNRHIASAGGGGAVIWDTGTGEQVRILSAPKHWVTSVAFSPDGTKILTGGWDNTAKLWDTLTGAEIRTFVGHTDWVESVAFSPDGTKVLTGSHDGSAKLWNAGTGALIRTFSGYLGSVGAVAFSPDGTKVLTGNWDGAKLWNAETGAEIRTLPGPGVSVAFSPDGAKILTGALDTPASLWDSQTGNLIRVFSESSSAVAFSPDGTKILTGGGFDDNTAKMWDAQTGTLIRTFSGHTMWVRSAVFSPDGSKVLTAGADYTIRLWNASTGTEIRMFLYNSYVPAVALSPDATKVLTGSWDTTAKLWDTQTGALLRTFSAHTGWISSVAFSPDGNTVLTASADRTVKLWNISTGGLIRTLSGHTDFIFSAAFSPDGMKIVTGSSTVNPPLFLGEAKIWNVSTGTEIRTLLGHASTVLAVAFSADGTKILTGSDDATAKLWDVSTGSEIRTFSGHMNSVSSVAFSPDATRVLTGSSDTTAKLWNASTGALIRTFSGHTWGITSVAFSPDGTRILTGSYDTTANLWNVETGIALQTFSGHMDRVTSVNFFPDGERVLTGSLDGLTFLWDIGEFTRNLDKLILIAGGGTYTGNSIANQTKALAELTYQTATIRGYPAQNIYYLSAFDTPASNPRVSAAADPAALLDAIRNWAADASRLTIMLIDHGEHDSAIPEWYFLMDGTQSPRRFLDASTLDAVLDEVQSATDPLAEAYVIVDACYAGGFVKQCSGAPVGRKRLVISSTTDSTLANFGAGNGAVSFTANFLSGALEGQTFFDCFLKSEDAMAALHYPPDAPQAPWLDDDGDGLYTGSDGDMARQRVFGTLPMFGFAIPRIVAAKPDAVLPAPQDFQLWCDTAVTTGGIKRSEAVVSFSDAANPGGAPITDFTIVPLAREGATQRYSGTLSASDLQREGAYTILYTAARDDGFGFDLSATPVSRLLTIGTGAGGEKDKLLLVAGGGAYPGNALANQTKNLIQCAWNVAATRGFAPENVQYLSAFETPPINPAVDGAASSAAISNAIGTWAAGATRLTIVLVGNGSRNTAIPEWYFEADGTQTTKDNLSASALDALLDAAQTGTGGIQEIILIVDASYSGGFMKTCSGAPTGKKRLVITGTSGARVANFTGSGGAFSFIGVFLAAALQGNTYYDCFLKASDAITILNAPAGAPQTPWLDDNGDGAFSGADGTFARQRMLGGRPMFGFLMPEIVAAKPDASIPTADNFGVWCETGPGEIKRVETIVSLRRADGNIPKATVSLSREGVTNRWSGVVPKSAFTAQSDYTILYTAYRDDGFGVDLAATPVARTLFIGAGAEENWRSYE